MIAESFERIHRSNLVGMGVLPLELVHGASAQSLGLGGRESFDLTGITSGLSPHCTVHVTATAADGTVTRLENTGAARLRRRC